MLPYWNSIIGCWWIFAIKVGHAGLIDRLKTHLIMAYLLAVAKQIQEELKSSVEHGPKLLSSRAINEFLFLLGYVLLA